MSNWTDGLVLGTSAASAGDDELRSLMTQLSSGLSPSFVWPGSGGGSAASAGESTFGNARCAHSGNVTGGYGVGFLSLNTLHPSLIHIGPSAHLVGHSAMVDHGIGAVLPSTDQWLTQSGTTILSIASYSYVTITFPRIYEAPPTFVQLAVAHTGLSNASVGYLMNLSSVTSGGFISAFSCLGAALPDVAPTLYWESDGSIPFA